MINILPKDGELYYFPDFYTQEQSKHFMSALTKKIKWQQDKIKMYGKEHNLPRLTSWYSHGGISYEYSGIKMLSNKIDFDEMEYLQLAVTTKSYLMGLIDSLPGYNSILCNLYRDGKDSVSWHSDDEKELGINPIISSITFGSTRTFKIRHKDDHHNQLSLELKSGSLVIMAGAMQHHWEHCIPKTSKVLEPRINLTFRNIS